MRLTINFEDWAADLVPPGDKALDGGHGRTIYPERRIVVRNDLAPLDRLKTLIHEVLHAYEDHVIPVGGNTPERRNNELYVTLHAGAIVGVLVSNPHLLAAVNDIISAHGDPDVESDRKRSSRSRPRRKDGGEGRQTDKGRGR